MIFVTQIIKTRLTPPIRPERAIAPKLQSPQVGFERYLSQAIEELKFSKHALSRLESRSLHPQPEQITRLKEGIAIARNKGSKNSLVLIDRLAFVVSIENNTVVTALSCDEKDGKVFTQIDSTVIN